MLKVAEEIEEKLKKVSLVGSRIGSGFSFIGNLRDVTRTPYWGAFGGKMKKLFFLIILLLCTTFIFSEPITDNGDHLVTFRISKLVGKGFKDEICIQNGSSYLLKNIQLRITIDGKDHKLLPIDQVKSGRDDNFDGLEDDEMHDELKYFFGEKGKLTRNNTNKISFEFSFGDNNEKVLLKEYHIRDNELYFFVENNENFKVTEELVEDSVKVIVIDGKKYMIIDDQVIEVK